MKKIDIEIVWNCIKIHEGEVFRQILGKAYTYEISNAALIPLGINQNIRKSEFAKALDYLPLSSTTTVQHLRGPSYIYSILMDESPVSVQVLQCGRADHADAVPRSLTASGK